jgi:hypothetical protein
MNATFALVCLLTSALCLQARGQSYSMNWFTIDGGGGASTGGVYAVSGTLGQPDAGGPISGGNYSLTGGFWSLSAAVQTLDAPWLWVARTSSNTVCVWWPVSNSSWQLQSTTALTGPTTVWTATAYTTNGANCVYIEAPPSGSKFYRLKQP